MSLVQINVYVDGKPQRTRRKLKLLWGIGPIAEQPASGPSRRHSMLQLTNTQQAGLSISAVDRRGNPAALDTIAFTSSDPSVATVTADDLDPSRAVVKAVAAGTTQINVTADADLGDSVNHLTGTLDLTVVPSQAVGLVIATGTPEEQPE